MTKDEKEQLLNWVKTTGPRYKGDAKRSCAEVVSSIQEADKIGGSEPSQLAKIDARFAALRCAVVTACEATVKAIDEMQAYLKERAKG